MHQPGEMPTRIPPFLTVAVLIVPGHVQNDEFMTLLVNNVLRTSQVQCGATFRRCLCFAGMIALFPVCAPLYSA
jgi:hypothetical protein